ncbi:MAG: winged helix-turn-helix transcriptional regulator [Clostridia bacterium]|nr:winged helix-turn-helix transcriptional regulator [Clostridia bacterium]
MNNIDNKIYEISELFKIFGDYTRCKIVAKLFEREENVSNLSKHLEMSTSAISHSLRILRQANIVKTQRRGKEIIYSLNDEHIYNIFQMAKEHVEEL